MVIMWLEHVIRQVNYSHWLIVIYYHDLILWVRQYIWFIHNLFMLFTIGLRSILFLLRYIVSR